MVIQKIVDWYKSWGFCGWLRFRTLWFAHRFIGDGLSEQWDFVLKNIDFFPSRILEIGSTYSLFLYELKHRNHNITSIDLRQYQENLPKGINFIKKDFLNINTDKKYETIILISVIQFIDNHKKLIRKIHDLLEPDGKLFITVPLNKETNDNLQDKLDGFFYIEDCQESNGHLSIYARRY